MQTIAIVFLINFDKLLCTCLAADYGSYVMIHAYHDRSINRAIDAGVKCVEHGFLMQEDTMKRMVKEGVAISIQAVMSLEACEPFYMVSLDLDSVHSGSSHKTLHLQLPIQKQ